MAVRTSHYRTPAPASVEQRSEPRLKLSITKTSVRRHGRNATDATLHDLSVYGCRIAAETSADKGDRLWLRFEGRLPIPATVVWGADGMVGCRFDEPIERSLMRALTLRIA